MFSEHPEFFLLFKWHPEQPVVNVVGSFSKALLITFNSLYILCHHFLQMSKQKVRQPAVKKQTMLKLGFLSYIIIQFIRMDYFVKIYFLPIAGDGGKDELLPHYIPGNASSSTFISTLNIRYAAQSGGWLSDQHVYTSWKYIHTCKSSRDCSKCCCTSKCRRGTVLAKRPHTADYMGAFWT